MGGGASLIPPEQSGGYGASSGEVGGTEAPFGLGYDGSLGVDRTASPFDLGSYLEPAFASDLAGGSLSPPTFGSRLDVGGVDNGGDASGRGGFALDQAATVVRSEGISPLTMSPTQSLFNAYVGGLDTDDVVAGLDAAAYSRRVAGLGSGVGHGGEARKTDGGWSEDIGLNPEMDALVRMRRGTRLCQ